MATLALALAAALASQGAGGGELLRQARAALETGDARRARRLAEEALESARGDLRLTLPVHREAQDILMAAGASTELVRRYDELLRKDVTDPLRRYLRARVEPDIGRRRRDLEAVLQASGELFWAAYDLAELWAREGAFARAVEYAERAARAAPREAAVWNVLGHLRLEASRFLDSPQERRKAALRAKEALEQAVSLDPSLAEARYNLGLVQYVLGEPERARESWEAALRLRSDFPEALNSLGHLASREGREDEAIAFYERAVAARAGYGLAHNNLAVAYYRKKDYARAAKHLALAEAAGYEVPASFKRVLARALEEEKFLEFQRDLAGAADRRVELYRAGAREPLPLSEPDRRALSAGVLKMTFRDSHGGVRLGERKVGSEVVANYSEAARLEITLIPRAAGARDSAAEKKTLLAVARESGGRRELAGWVVEGGLRFSAEAPELARELGRILSMEIYGAGEPGPEKAWR